MVSQEIAENYLDGHLRPRGSDEGCTVKMRLLPLRNVFELLKAAVDKEPGPRYIEILKSLPVGVAQVVVYPGFYDSELCAIASRRLRWGALRHEDDTLRIRAPRNAKPLLRWVPRLQTGEPWKRLWGV